jgi:hypothetical protein
VLLEGFLVWGSTILSCLSSDVTYFVVLLLQENMEPPSLSYKQKFDLTWNIVFPHLIAIMQLVWHF